MKKTLWIVTIVKQNKTVNYAIFEYLKDAKEFISFFSLMDGKVSGKISIGEVNKLYKSNLIEKRNNLIKFKTS